jgi:hypothetical protein
MTDRKASFSPYHPCADKANNEEPIPRLLCNKGERKVAEEKIPDVRSDFY